jgi:hypothetical protein
VACRVDGKADEIVELQLILHGGISKTAQIYIAR